MAIIGIWLAIAVVILMGAAAAGHRGSEDLSDTLELASIFWTFWGIPLTIFAIA